jgi:starch synthase (maltosyl-transferring)
MPRSKPLEPKEQSTGGTASRGGSPGSRANGASRLKAGTRESQPTQTTAPPRVILEGVRPEIDGGHYPARATVGERIVVEADIYADGHDSLAADLLYRVGSGTWKRLAMRPLVNDRWQVMLPAAQMGTYSFTIEAWVDHFGTWRNGLQKKSEAGQDVSSEMLIGSRLIQEALPRARTVDAERLRNAAAKLAGRTSVAGKMEVALDRDLAVRMRNTVDPGQVTRYEKELRIQVERSKAAFSAWYEMFPRSASPDPARAGTFRDVEARLPYVARMGFDVLYLPPIHPIGHTKRKGANNTLEAKKGDPGSPWAIGSEAGGHKSVNPELGTLEDFRRLVRKATDHGIDLALDIAFQCSPDHPYVKEHPEWFRLRPDGSVQYAENPPKKYEDIYPFNFETPAWESLWQELLSVFLFWMEQGVSIFRVDNPHTKPFAFWEWLISEVHKVNPGVILLSEAFTRPKIMYHLAKLGFTQSYTYFAWRPDMQGLTEYFTELTSPPVCDFFRPNAWPNTPDILTEQLEAGARSTFVARLVLAGTLSSNYGIYGPPFELMDNKRRDSDSEEYLNSEKYEVKHWDIERKDSLRELITLVNKARRENAALQSNTSLRFHEIDNEQLIAYSKATDGNVIICVVNLDPRYRQSGFLGLPLADWGVAEDEPYQVHDLLSDARYTWMGERNFVQLDPNVMPAHVFRLRRRTGGATWEFE